MIIFVGDIHGDIATLYKVIDKYKGHRIIFVGDYLDSFTQPIKNQIDCLKRVLEPDVEACLGNHELSYIYESQRCGGWKEEVQREVDENYREDMLIKLKRFIWIKEDNILVTHAGLTKSLARLNGITHRNTEYQMNMALSYLIGSMYQRGRKREGTESAGGIFWCHYPDEFEGVHGMKQVFGHTPQTQINSLFDEGFDWNIDCLYSKKQVLIYDKGFRIEDI